MVKCMPSLGWERFPWVAHLYCWLYTDCEVHGFLLIGLHLLDKGTTRLFLLEISVNDK